MGSNTTTLKAKVINGNLPLNYAYTQNLNSKMTGRANTICEKLWYYQERISLFSDCLAYIKMVSVVFIIQALYIKSNTKLRFFILY